ncbi:hypothetical protein LINPERPRIM_LOCUS25767 [Linum perenne]
MIGRCLTKKRISLGAVIGVTRKEWLNLGQARVKELPNRPNIFVFSFPTERFHHEAWNNQPYVVSGTILSLKYWDGIGKPTQQCFKNIPLWIHVLDIPLHVRSLETINTIMNNYYPSLLAVDPAGLDKGNWSRSMRVFAEVTVADPLTTTCTLQLPDRQEHIISFKYERIQAFCLYCGRLGHVLELCKDRDEDMAKGLPGIPSREFKPSLKVGIPSDSDDEEEDSSGGSNSFGLIPDPYAPYMTHHSPSPTASLFPQGTTSQLRRSLERRIPDLNSTTQSPELVTPTLQLLFPESPHLHHSITLRRDITPAILNRAFDSAATQKGE